MRFGSLQDQAAAAMRNATGDAKRRHGAMHWKEAERMRLARKCQPNHGADLRRNGRDKTWQGDKGPGELPEFGRMAGSVPLPQFGRIRPCRCRAGPQYHRRDRRRAAGTWRPAPLTWASGAGSARHAAER